MKIYEEQLNYTIMIAGCIYPVSMLMGETLHEHCHA